MFIPKKKVNLRVKSLHIALILLVALLLFVGDQAVRVGAVFREESLRNQKKGNGPSPNR